MRPQPSRRLPLPSLVCRPSRNEVPAWQKPQAAKSRALAACGRRGSMCSSFSTKVCARSKHTGDPALVSLPAQKKRRRCVHTAQRAATLSDLHGLPFESMPALRGQPVTRLPALHFALRADVSCSIMAAPYCVCHMSLACLPRSPLAFATLPQWPTQRSVNSGVFVLNPGGDLARTQERLHGFFTADMGWSGTAGSPPDKAAVGRRWPWWTAHWHR